MKICSANQRAVNIHLIAQLAVTFLLFSETSCLMTKYVYEGPDGCNSKKCMCETDTNVDKASLVTTKVTVCYNLSTYEGPGQYFIRRIPQPFVNGIVNVRGFMASKVNQAKSYCHNAQMNDKLCKAKENVALRASELKSQIGSTYDATKGKIETFWQKLRRNFFGEEVGGAVGK